MTITINLQPKVERALLAHAQARGVSLAEYAQEVLAGKAAETIENPSATLGAAANSLFELFTPVRGLLTEEEADTLFARNRSVSRPVDLA